MTKYTKASILVLVCAGLFGCGGGGSGSGGGMGGSPGEGFNIGTTDPTQAANGLLFASGTQDLSDLEATPVAVRVVRFVTDYGTGNTTLVLSDETVTLEVDGLVQSGAEKTITVDGETLVFDLAAATASDGAIYASFQEDLGLHSTVLGLASYSADGTTGFDTAGFYVLGFETDPDVIAAKPTGTVSYDGAFGGTGQVLDLTGAVVESEISIDGTIMLVVDFGTNNIDGTLAGTLDYGAGLDIAMTLDTASIAGNGFAGTLSNDCGAGETCTSNSQIGGAFFGPNGEELTGLIGFDETIEGSSEGDLNYVGAGGYLTIEIP